MQSNPSEVRETDVLVVGAGPVGLTLANTLAQYGVKCTLVERSQEVGLLPKMDLSNPRTMEIFGRLGLAEKVRRAGWPLDAHLDVLVGPSLVGRPYKVLPYPSIEEMQAQIARVNDGSMPREPYERISQYNLEALLRAELGKQPSACSRYGYELIGFADNGEYVDAQVRNPKGMTSTIRCKYLVGCDGGNSKVRSLLGIELSGRAAVGRMMMIFFRCPELLPKTGLSPFRHFYIAGERHAVLVAQDDLKRWSLHIMISAKTDVSALDPKEEIRAALGIDLETEILYSGAWTPHLLVANEYRKDNVFLAGDSVHQYIPTGGFGMNTGVSEADNLAWKLAATVLGWGGPKLLDSYHDERHPVAVRNCRAASYAAEGVEMWRRLYVPAVLEATDSGRALRERLAESIDKLQRRSHEQRGIELGYRYVASPICLHEAGEAPDADSPDYLPAAVPGARLPHAWLEEGVSVHDRCGRGMTLLAFDAEAKDVRTFAHEARDKNIPLEVVATSGQQHLRTLYGARLLLLRPDLHVAWRGDSIKDTAKAGHVLNLATGW